MGGSRERAADTFIGEPRERAGRVDYREAAEQVADRDVQKHPPLELAQRSGCLLAIRYCTRLISD